VVPHAAIEAHEDAANWFLAATAGVLALSILPLAIKRPELHRAFVAATVIGTVFVMFVAQRVGEHGGEDGKEFRLRTELVLQLFSLFIHNH
jgi:hypothetical protein